MMRAVFAVLLLASAPTAPARDDATVKAGDPALLSSRLDYTQAVNRDLPIRCKEGDIEYFAGKSLGEVFGHAWPTTPVATSHERARMAHPVAPTWPKGLGQSGAIVVVAALVDSQGKVIDARAICASTPSISKPAVRATLRSRFEPARFDGVATTSVAIWLVRFGLHEKPSTPVPPRPGDR